MNIYDRALANGVWLEDTCVSCGSQDKWDQYMEGATRADRKKVLRIAIKAGIADPVELSRPYYNPYNHYKTKTHIVYVNSAIEHFLRVNE